MIHIICMYMPELGVMCVCVCVCVYVHVFVHHLHTCILKLVHAFSTSDYITGYSCWNQVWMFVLSSLTIE